MRTGFARESTCQTIRLRRSAEVLDLHRPPCQHLPRCPGRANPLREVLARLVGHLGPADPYYVASRRTFLKRAIAVWSWGSPKSRNASHHPLLVGALPLLSSIVLHSLPRRCDPEIQQYTLDLPTYTGSLSSCSPGTPEENQLTHLRNRESPTSMMRDLQQHLSSLASGVLQLGIVSVLHWDGHIASLFSNRGMKRPGFPL